MSTNNKALNPDDYREEVFIGMENEGVISCVVHRATDTIVFVAINLDYLNKNSKVEKNLRNLEKSLDCGKGHIALCGGFFRGHIEYIHYWSDKELEKAEKRGTLQYFCLNSSDMPIEETLPFSRTWSQFLKDMEKNGFSADRCLDVEKEMMPWIFPERCGGETWSLSEHFSDLLGS